MKDKQLLRYSNHKREHWLPQSHLCTTTGTRKHSVLAGQNLHVRDRCSPASAAKSPTSQVKYDPMFTCTYEALRQTGFSVEPLLGTSNASAFLVRDGLAEQFALVGCYGSYAERVDVVHWIKERWPFMRVIAIQHYAENPLVGADLSIAGEFDVSQVKT